MSPISRRNGLLIGLLMLSPAALAQTPQVAPPQLPSPRPPETAILGVGELLRLRAELTAQQGKDVYFSQYVRGLDNLPTSCAPDAPKGSFRQRPDGLIERCGGAP
jgi:hypothetical protein